jgi:hypothetical protein
MPLVQVLPHVRGVMGRVHRTRLITSTSGGVMGRVHRTGLITSQSGGLLGRTHRTRLITSTYLRWWWVMCIAQESSCLYLLGGVCITPTSGGRGGCVMHKTHHLPFWVGWWVMCIETSIDTSRGISPTGSSLVLCGLLSMGRNSAVLYTRLNLSI